MIMLTTGQIPERQAVEGAILAMAMTMTTARVKRTRRALRKGPGRGKEHRTGRGKGRGRGRETVKGKVLLNEPQGEMISLVPLLCSCRSKCQRQTWTRRAK
jgi:ribosomal protein L15